MYTNENPLAELYDDACFDNDAEHDIHSDMHHARKKKHSRKKKQLRLIFSAAVFTLTLTAAAGWQVLGRHTLSDFSTNTPAVPATKYRRNTDDISRTAADPAAPDVSKNEDGLTDAEMELAMAEKRTDITSKKDKETTHITNVSEDWNLVLVNPWNPLPENFEISLMPLENGQFIDSRCYTKLEKMIQDCRAEGLQPLICSSYRTLEMQETLFQQRISELTAEGYSDQDARKKAATSVAIPGTSEHQLGLAVDIVDRNQQMLNSAQENTLVQQWLMENSWRYGFILRYPNDKSSLTGIIYEPWHYRYVGRKAAKEIYRRGICLEEYLEEQLQE